MRRRIAFIALDGLPDFPANPGLIFPQFKENCSPACSTLPRSQVRKRFPLRLRSRESLACGFWIVGAT